MGLEWGTGGLGTVGSRGCLIGGLWLLCPDRMHTCTQRYTAFRDSRLHRFEVCRHFLGI
jgi:hypothetical protein